MVMVTPGITAFWVSVTEPCRVAVDWAHAGVKLPHRIATRIANRIVSSLVGWRNVASASGWKVVKDSKKTKKGRRFHGGLSVSWIRACGLDDRLVKDRRRL